MPLARWWNATLPWFTVWRSAVCGSGAGAGGDANRVHHSRPASRLADGTPSLGGWLYRTTVHLAQHELRAEQRRRRREEIALELGTCMKMDESLLLNIAPLLDEAMLELRASDPRGAAVALLREQVLARSRRRFGHRRRRRPKARRESRGTSPRRDDSVSVGSGLSALPLWLRPCSRRPPMRCPRVWS